MFSQEPRCIYRRNPLGEVICQLRFPEILSIGAKLPVDFQEAIREEYPQYLARKEAGPPKITGTPGNFQLQQPPATVNYQFSSADGLWRVNLTSRFISLACSRYTCWEDFCQKLDKPLVSFIQIYKPAYFERVGLRYLNFFSRKALDLEEVPFSELFAACYLGPLAEEDVADPSVIRSTVDFELKLRGGCRAKVHAGPGLVKQKGQTDGEFRFILDQDLYMPGNVPVNTCVGALQTLHSQAWPLFRGAITPMLHQAMEPMEI